MSERRLCVLTAEGIVSYRPGDRAWRASNAAARRGSGCQRAWPDLSARVGRCDGRSRTREADRACGGCSGTLSRSPEPRSSAAKPLCRFAERRIGGLWRSPPRGSLGAAPGLISSSLSRVFHPALSHGRGRPMWPFRAHNQALGQLSWCDPAPAGFAVSGRFLNGPPCARIQGRDWRAKRDHRGRGEPRRAAG